MDELKKQDLKFAAILAIAAMVGSFIGNLLADAFNAMIR